MRRTPEAADLDPPVKRLDDEHVAYATPAVQSLPAGARLMSDAIWHGSPDLDQANELSAGCAIGHLGIEFTELGADHLIGRMPVDSRTRQPFGILHGGSSVLLAESLVSCAATFVAGPGKACVGMEINANHLRQAAARILACVVEEVRRRPTDRKMDGRTAHGIPPVGGSASDPHGPGVDAAHGLGDGADGLGDVLHDPQPDQR